MVIKAYVWVESPENTGTKEQKIESLHFMMPNDDGNKIRRLYTEDHGIRTSYIGLISRVEGKDITEPDDFKRRFARAAQELSLSLRSEEISYGPPVDYKPERGRVAYAFEDTHFSALKDHITK